MPSTSYRSQRAASTPRTTPNALSRHQQGRRSVRDPLQPAQIPGGVPPGALGCLGKGQRVLGSSTCPVCSCDQGVSTQTLGLAALTPPAPRQPRQESGRAGRDGRPATCLLYYSYADAAKSRHMLRQSAEENRSPAEQLKSNEESLNAMVGGRGFSGAGLGVGTAGVFEVTPRTAACNAILAMDSKPFNNSCCRALAPARPSSPPACPSLRRLRTARSRSSAAGCSCCITLGSTALIRARWSGCGNLVGQGRVFMTQPGCP